MLRHYAMLMMLPDAAIYAAMLLLSLMPR